MGTTIEVIKHSENGRTALYQWDTGRKIKIQSKKMVDEVHFSNVLSKGALVVTPNIDAENGAITADIPNILLQTFMVIDVWIVCHSEDGEYTNNHEKLDVMKRPKPSDYVYTETEILRYESLEARVNALEEKSGGISSAARALLITILQDCVTGSDQTPNIEALEQALSPSGSEPEKDATLVSISATYTGEEVTVGTAITDLTGIVVLAKYSDGTNTTVTDYTLSGEIAEGENTIIVFYSGMTTTFIVTGVAESSGETATYGLHHDAGFKGKLKTGIKSTTTTFTNIDKVVLDVDIITKKLLTSKGILFMYPWTSKLEMNSSGEWVFCNSTSKVSVDKTPSEVMGTGRTTITFSRITGYTESNTYCWYLLDGSANTMEMTWYGAKFYSGDTLKADLKPTVNAGEMYDSVSNTTYTFDVTDGLTVVEV